MKKVSLLILLSFFATVSQSGFAQEVKKTKVFPFGVVDEIQSSTLSEKRTMNIYLPDGYDTAKTNYPVIYLLDGSANEDFVHVVGLVQFLNMIEAMPKSIVVGIANVDRKRDFTFPTTIAKDKEDYPTTGGSEKFIAFLEKELKPFIRRKYKCGTSETIIGQSLGGLVATEILLKKPLLFNTYIIVSPSLWWDNESLIGKAPGLLKSLPAGPMRVYIAVGGGEEKQMIDDAGKFTDLLNASGTPNVQTDYVVMPEENHLTILHNALYKAFTKLNAKK